METPPTSQRSQIVNSGSMPIKPCSAACTAPTTSDASMPAASNPSDGTVYQQARVTSARSGSSRSRTSMMLFVEICLRWNATT